METLRSGQKFATLLGATGTLLGMHLAWVGAENYRELAGLDVKLIFPTIPALIGVAILLLLTLLATLPGVWSVVRPQPAALMAAGRNG